MLKPSDLHVVRSDGSQLKRISTTSGDKEGDSWPDISPDGSRVVYITTRHRSAGRRNNEIETVKLDGSDRRRLTDSPASDRYPAWSPDGGQVAFLSEDDDGYDNIMVMSADGSDKTTVFDARSFDPGAFGLEAGELEDNFLRIYAGPEWSPDGKKLSFIVYYRFERPAEPRTATTGRFDVLYTVRADGEGLTLLFVASSVQDGLAPEMAWSPDGREIAFLYYDTETEGWPLYTVGPDGSGLRKVLGNHMLPSGNEHPYISNLSWSPTGEDFLFGLFQRHAPDVGVAKADGSEYFRLGRGMYPSWSPDGSRIAIRVGVYGNYLATIAPDGSDERFLVLAYKDGSLRAAYPNQRCIFRFCWWEDSQAGWS